MSIKNVNGIWLPEHEAHLTHYAKGEYGKWTYQLHKLQAALDYIKDIRVAIDIGGHCGLWSKELIKVFDHVHAFEPLDIHRQCYVKNVPFNYSLHHCALGKEEGTVNIYTTPGSSGDSFVDGEGEIPLKTLDSFGIRHVGLIKVDCEGYELFALQGGEKTILDSNPVVIVEQKPGKAEKFGLKQTEAVDYLLSLGMVLKKEMVGDFILAWQ
jgi:FkbM family methyltransferase